MARNPTYQSPTAMNTDMFVIDGEELADLDRELGARPRARFESRGDIVREVKLRVLAALQNDSYEPPRLPTVAAEVMQLARDEEVSIARLGRLIQSDQFLAGATLRTVNSAFFAPRNGRRITSIPEAIARLGLLQTQNVVLSAAMGQTIYHGPHRELMLDLWQAALGGAVAFSLLSQIMDQNAELAFLVGLLHDVGKPVLANILDEVLTEATSELPYDTAVEEVFHLLHARAGAHIVGLWELPESFVRIIAHHHDRMPPADLKRNTGMLRLADLIYEHWLVEGEELHLSSSLLEHHLVDRLDIPVGRLERILALYPGALASFLEIGQPS